MSYSEDFRKRVLDYSNTSTLLETAQIFKIAVRTICNWKKLQKQTGSLENRPLNRKPRKLDYGKLIEYMKIHPDAYMREVAAKFNVSESAISDALKRLGFTLKKRPNYTGKETRRNVRSISKRFQSLIKKR